MDWTILIIPIIGVVVWILSNLVSSQQQQQRGRTPRTPRPTPADEESAAPRPRRSASDVEKFLEEVRRRRDVEETRKQRIPGETVAERRDADAAREAMRKRLESERRRRAVPPPLPEEVLIAKPVPPPLRETVVAPAPAPGPASHTVTPVVGVQQTAVLSSPLDLLSLLRQPQTMAAAVVLHEILQPPLARRHSGLRRR